MRGKIINGVYHKTEKEGSRLKIGGGSWTVLRSEVDFSTVKGVSYRTELGTYTISSADALAHGWALTLGGEEKWVVPIKRWLFERRMDESKVETQRS